LNLSYFISKRINSKQQAGFTGTIHKIAVVSISIGLAAAIVSFLVMKGFQNTVKDKIYAFSGHIIVTRFSMNNSPEERGMNYHINVYDHVKKFPFISHIQEYAHKPGLVKTDDEVFGVIVKGIGKSFDTTRFRPNLIEGRFIRIPDSTYANEVVISKTISDKLKAKVGDDIMIHFFQNPPRHRRLKITGIYETNLSEYFDSRVIISDIRMIQRLNDWSDSLAGGLEVFLNFNHFAANDLRMKHSAIAADQEDSEFDGPKPKGFFQNFIQFDYSKAVVDESIKLIGETMDYDLNLERVSDRYQQVFEWLQLLSRQVNILLVIILTVICVNMISIVLILVMERTQMIGLLKALGAGDKTIRAVFIYNGVALIAKGLFFGNLLGLGICFLQDQFKIIKLNPHDYYMSFVPISWHWEIVIILNLLTFLVVTVVLLIPTMVISRINPIKAIRFD
jgi:lipoprotein-releasing system permease protein